ncbi:hypothetical protein BZG36_05546 [Bifiguratus adelaidae]|uniref:Uncharacterized protein n=1 Tax=Bifiguratus adelaidae TaxID=1938954 RepID=A0A261XST2_9FUNG|nr:hypothetical protein BZG36_05546 [Bifiguratus adelaidae]
MWEDLRSVELDNIIKGMEGGLDAELNSGEKDVLSAGETQLLCLARAILENRRIVLLNEATSALDASTKAKINSLVELTFKNSTVIWITHCPETAQRADTVLVLDQGRVVEYDTPSALLSRSNSDFGNLFEKKQNTIESAQA